MKTHIRLQILKLDNKILVIYTIVYVKLSFDDDFQLFMAKKYVFVSCIVF